MDNQPEASKSVNNINTDVSQISIQEFLNFLKTAYQIQDSVEGILMSGGMSEAVNWLKRKENQQALKSICCQTSDTTINTDRGSGDDGAVAKEPSETKSSGSVSDSDPLKRKLSEVLSEGLLDSVLPYLVQSASTSLKKNSLISLYEKLSQTSTLSTASSTSNEKLMIRRTSTDSSFKPILTKIDSDKLVLNVCDSTNNRSKTFVCSRKLIMETMKFFLEENLGQTLDNTEVSVYCEVDVFEWLIEWVNRDPLLEETWPQLNPKNAIPILISSCYLLMEPLLNDCLLYCHQHMNEILRACVANMSCMYGPVLSRLAAMYTNVELEAVKDRKDRIQSRLFTQLIMSLAEPEPESVRGHWCSLARLFRCEKCKQLITPAVATKIPCVPTCMRLQPDGAVISLHVRDPTWNINDYVLKLQKHFKTWRKVYWRLWGDAHFLFCSVCKRYFPAYQINWCRYHPDTPQFFTLDAQKAPLPIGRYPCCGDRAYKFQLLESYTGCQFRQHMVCTQDVRDSAIFTMLEAYRYVIEEEPPELTFQERLTRLVTRGKRWFA